MTGLEMLPKVRELRPDVPVIMITAYGDSETRRIAIERDAEGLLTKPIDFSLLREESMRGLNGYALVDQGRRPFACVNSIAW